MAGFRNRFMTMSTSPRSPRRIPHYLTLLEEFSGQKWNKETQTKYYKSMVNNQEGDYTIGASKSPDFSARDKINRAPKALGFVSLKPTVSLTSPGKNLLSPFIFQDVLTKQLLKYQLPSPFLPETSDNEGYFNIKPYLELLRLISHVSNLKRSEFFAFGVTLRDYHDFDDTCARLQEYRKDAKQEHLSSRKHYDTFMRAYIKELYRDKLAANDLFVRESKEQTPTKFIQTKLNNIRDYGDAYLRYLIGTGLVVVNKRLEVVIAPDKKEDVNFILSHISRNADQYTLGEYESIMFDTNTPQLLSDNSRNLIHKIKSIDNKLKATFSISTNAHYSSKSTMQLKEILYSKEEKLQNLVRQDYAKSLKNYSTREINDVLTTFDGIKENKFFDNPLYLEWNCWRAITMIDNGNIMGAFKTNSEGDPINTAPGNTADIIGDYGTFNMICEVTLSAGKKQYEMENEPVTRHLGTLRTDQNGKETFGLFIAKKIQPNVITEFYYKHRIPTKLYGGTVEFIPLTISDFCTFFIHSTQKDHKLSAEAIRNIHTKTIEYARDASDEEEWYNHIRNYILSI